MRCPNCFSIMEVHYYHYSDETVKVYKCPKCGYREVHHYPKEKDIFKPQPTQWQVSV